MSRRKISAADSAWADLVRMRSDHDARSESIHRGRVVTRHRETARDAIVEEVRRTATAPRGCDDLRFFLMKRGLGAGQANTLANTALAQFDNSYTQEISRRAGVEKFLYDGVLHPTSRPFCKQHYGKLFTIAEIVQMDNGQGIPVLTSCGGYNCVHYWTPEVE